MENGNSRSEHVTWVFWWIILIAMMLIGLGLFLFIQWMPGR
jgi:hypothetical protein